MTKSGKKDCLPLLCLKVLVENRMKKLLEYYDIADLSNMSGG